MFGLHASTASTAPRLWSRASTQQATDHMALALEQQEDEHAHAEQATALLAQIARHDEHAATIHAQLQEALTHRSTLQQKLTQESISFDKRRAAREKRLCDLADPRIGKFIAWLDTERQQLHWKIVERAGFTDFNVTLGRRVEVRSSNAPAIALISNALVRAREQAELLKITLVADIDSSIESIRKGIPTVDEAEDQLARARS